MKRITKILSISLAMLMLSHTVLAADTVTRTYPISTLNLTDAVSKTNLTPLTGSAYTTPTLVACDDVGYTGTALKMEGTADTTARVDDAGFNTGGNDPFVYELMVKPDTSKAGTLSFLLSKPSFFFLLQFKQTQVYALHPSSENASAKINLTVSDKWYNVKFVFRSKPSYKIDAYIDDVLVRTYSDSATVQSLMTGVKSLRIVADKNSAMYLGDGSIYSPEAVQLTAKNYENELATDPVTVNFSKPVELNSTSDAQIGKENFTVTDKDGNNVAINAVDTAINSDGKVTSATLTFEDGALTAGGKYYVALGGCIGSYGQSIAEPKDGSYTFCVLPEPYNYSWDSVKVFGGMGANKAEVSALKSGMISIDAQYSNGGRLSGEVSLTARVFKGDTLIRQFETLGRVIGSNGASLKTSFGFYLASASDVTISLTLTDADGKILLEKKGADIFEN